ncbi:MAG: hypothetical protein LBB07_01800 [Bifidobacteriaceae bacterium]|jgi:hypothetical protein|nr:hypothetical protein [Bifidobacteriaceae bacterium]
MTSYRTIRYVWSAFKHNYSIDQIEYMIENAVDAKKSKKRNEVWYLLSYDEKALPVIITYEEIDSNAILVFHCEELKNSRNWSRI